jgi:hypothetical protein
MMKKLFILVFIIILVSCKKDDKLSFMIPYGNPMIASLYVMDDEENFHVDIVSGPDALVSAFGSLSHDVIIAPITLGAKFYNAKDDYHLLSVITWGNYYIISESSLELTSLVNQIVYVFGQNQVSDIVMRAINDHYQLNLSFHYLDSMQSAAAHITLHPTDYVLISDPAYSQMMKNNPSLHGLNLDILYNDMTSLSLPQSGVFVKKSLSSDEKLQIAHAITESIAKLNDQTEESIQLALSLGLTWDEDILESVFLSNQIESVDAKDAQDDVEGLLNYVLTYQPNLISHMLPNDSFYGGN